MSHLANSKVRHVAAKQWPITTVIFAFIAVRYRFTKLYRVLRSYARFTVYTVLPAASGLDSSTGQALHLYRLGHGLKSCSSLERLHCF